MLFLIFYLVFSAVVSLSYFTRGVEKPPMLIGIAGIILILAISPIVIPSLMGAALDKYINET